MRRLSPHLHIAGLALQHDSDPLRTWSVPLEWRDVTVRRGSETEAHAWWVPPSGVWVASR